ncbi:MAG: D-Ala-D-Ala carboxypeptidase family metallohydrolase, partial [bacterium]|nr:D-Ala-D-Ala carboxypeptidase family metallohydrolase [bacterium]
LGPASAGFKNSKRLTTSNDGKLPIKDNPGKASKETIIQSMNHFIRDIFEPWAAWLKQKHPQVYKQVYITSAIRNSRPQGGSSNSRHFYGQAIDFQIIRGNRIEEELDWNLRLFNTIMEWYQENPQLKWDQLLLETRNNRNSIWIHWGYNWEGENRGMRRRFKNDSTLWSADMNGVNKRGQVSRADAKFL